VSRRWRLPHHCHHRQLPIEPSRNSEEAAAWKTDEVRFRERNVPTDHQVGFQRWSGPLPP